MKASSISFKISQWDRKELQNSWQRNVSSHKRIGELKTFIRKYKVQVWDLNRLQELRVFHKDTEVEQKTSLLGPLPVKIWLYFKTYSGNEDKKDRWT